MAAVRIERAQRPAATTPTLTSRRKDASAPNALRAPSVADSAFGMVIEDAKQHLGLQENFDSVCPTDRIAALHAPTPDPRRLRFLLDGAQVNILAQVRRTLPALASGLS